MNPNLTHIVCLECGHEMAVGEDFPTACSRCGGSWLDARYDYAAVAQMWPQALSMRERSLWRYHELLPLQTPDPDIFMGEGYTPLLRLSPYEAQYHKDQLYIKDERRQPTNSFKDRQAAMSVTYLRRSGQREVVLASTGNAAVAYAAYCARAGIKLWLFLTSLVPSEKMREAALYGAEVVKVSGTYDETKKVAAEFAERKGIPMDKGAKTIPSKESMKTLAYEIAEQLGLMRHPNQPNRWHAPDWYVQAVSGGIGPLGVWKGFRELHQMGLIDRVPRLAIVQAAEIHCAGGVFWGVQYHPEFSISLVSRLLRANAQLHVEEGRFADEAQLAGYCDDLDALCANPVPSHATWRYGIGPEILNRERRVTEIRNFIAQRVRPYVALRRAA